MEWNEEITFEELMDKNLSYQARIAKELTAPFGCKFLINSYLL